MPLEMGMPTQLISSTSPAPLYVPTPGQPPIQPNGKSSLSVSHGAEAQLTQDADSKGIIGGKEATPSVASSKHKRPREGSAAFHRPPKKQQKNHSKKGPSTSAPRKRGKKHCNFTYQQVTILRKWFMEHLDDPYPSPLVKEDLCAKTGLSWKQVSDWFQNARCRTLPKSLPNARSRSTLAKAKNGNMMNAATNEWKSTPVPAAATVQQLQQQQQRPGSVDVPVVVSVPMLATSLQISSQPPTPLTNTLAPDLTSSSSNIAPPQPPPLPATMMMMMSPLSLSSPSSPSIQQQAGRGRAAMAAASAATPAHSIPQRSTETHTAPLPGNGMNLFPTMRTFGVPGALAASSGTMPSSSLSHAQKVSSAVVPPPSAPGPAAAAAAAVSGRKQVKRRARLPRKAREVLQDWFVAHITYPYPTASEKQMLQKQTGLTPRQIFNWFTNRRKRDPKWTPQRRSAPSPSASSSLSSPSTKAAKATAAGNAADVTPPTESTVTAAASLPMTAATPSSGDTKANMASNPGHSNSIGVMATGLSTAHITSTNASAAIDTVRMGEQVLALVQDPPPPPLPPLPQKKSSSSTTPAGGGQATVILTLPPTSLNILPSAGAPPPAPPPPQTLTHLPPPSLPPSLLTPLPSTEGEQKTVITTEQSVSPARVITEPAAAAATNQTTHEPPQPLPSPTPPPPPVNNAAAAAAAAAATAQSQSLLAVPAAAPPPPPAKAASSSSSKINLAAAAAAPAAAVHVVSSSSSPQAAPSPAPVPSSQNGIHQQLQRPQVGDGVVAASVISGSVDLAADKPSMPLTSGDSKDAPMVPVPPRNSSNSVDGSASSQLSTTVLSSPPPSKSGGVAGESASKESKKTMVASTQASTERTGVGNAPPQPPQTSSSSSSSSSKTGKKKKKPDLGSEAELLLALAG